VAIASGGVLAWLPFFHAARHLGDRGLHRLTWIYGVAGVALLALVGSTPTDAAGNAIGAAGQVLQVIFGCLAVTVIGAACVQIAPLRRQVYGLPGGPASTAPAPVSHMPEVAETDPAVSAVLAARARRTDARELATKDPLMARELHIGRPDLGHRYDDGGLVDLNTAPPAVIARMCQIDVASAQLIVQARNRGGGFSNVEEVFVVTDLPFSTWDRIRDRAVLLS
jgi:DNA uptake protein ComE-like DNA-binding protein